MSRHPTLTVFRASCCLLLTIAAASAQAPLPVRATATVDTAELATTGRAVLQLGFTAESTIRTPFAIRVELRSGRRQVQRRDHAPPDAITTWAPDKQVAYDLSLFFAVPPEVDGEITVWLGFLDPSDGKCRPPLSDEIERDGMVRVAAFRFPDAEPTIDAAAVGAIVAAALDRAKRDPRAAWDQLEHAFRRTPDYAQKTKLQQALLVVGRSQPAALSFEEREIVANRIQAERARYLREVAGWLYDRGLLLGALLLLDEVGGALQEDADRAVIGALNEAERVNKDRDAIAAKVFALDEDAQAAVAKLVEQHPDESARLAFGIELAKDKKKRHIAREVVRTVEFTPEQRSEAERARREIERAWLADVPPAERAEADAAMQHECWGRTSQRVSHRFVLIGPNKLLAGIPAESLLRLDLAYLYQTDLFGRVPNPDGDRITLYFKELWDFGGGIGGGKIIDVGRADPNAKDLRVDGGLYYHELGHCVDDTAPIHAGWREGLADFAAAFCYDQLGQTAQARASIGLARRAFLADYLERDLEYWRMPNYGPSAGFLLHFVHEYGRDDTRYEWQRYREFFRNYRDCPVKDARTPNLSRAFAFHLVQAFGEAAFADLVKFRFPLTNEDLDEIRREQRAARDESMVRALDGSLGSPVPRDRMARSLAGSDAGILEYARELGVVTDWWVIGPFKKQGIDADTYRFAPEFEVDFAARYQSIENTPTWRRPGPRPVTIEDTGWLKFEFSYMDDSAIYALTHVNVEAATEAWFHLRADDDATLFVDDRLIGKYDGAGGPLGPWRPGWRVLLPDAMRFRVDLDKGRHKVLLKIYNRHGGSGCSLAIATRNGTPLAGWSSDAEPPERRSATIEPPDVKRWRPVFAIDGANTGSSRKLDVTVGEWRVRNRALAGVASDRGVEWRKYTVRPGFPKDSPSNLAWLPEKVTDDVDDFLLTIDLEEKSPPPKLCVTFQGDGLRDGLSGWTLILDPRGESGVQAMLERYDRRVYQSDVVPFAGDAERPTRLSLLYYGQRLTVRLGDAVVFDQVSIRAIPGRHRVGIATWGSQPRVTELALRAPPRTR